MKSEETFGLGHNGCMVIKKIIVSIELQYLKEPEDTTTAAVLPFISH